MTTVRDAAGGQSKFGAGPVQVIRSASQLASWIFGGVLVVFFILVVFALPNLTDDRRAIIRLLMALDSAFLAFFFVGGIVLKGTIKGLALSATGGFVLFVLIQFIFDPFSRSSSSTPSGLTLVTSVQIIENEFRQTSGNAELPSEVKELIQSAVNLAKAGQYKTSRTLFERASATVKVPAIFTNLGALYQESGDYSRAQAEFEHAVAVNPTYAPAVQNLQKLVRLEAQHVTDVRGQESEPNNDFNHTNLIQVNAKITAAIDPASDTDFYQFTTLRGPRDIYEASVENVATTLHPGITVFDGNRHQICVNYSDEALATLPCAFPALQGSTFYVQVWPRGGSGLYALIVRALRRYDRYEPNDDFPQATKLTLGNRIEANIMDGSDIDFFIVANGGAAAQLTARIDNDSSGLHPGMTVFDGNRHQVCANYSDEPLAQLTCGFAAMPNSSYYVEVWPKGGAGPYKLTVN